MSGQFPSSLGGRQAFPFRHIVNVGPGRFSPSSRTESGLLHARVTRHVIRANCMLRARGRNDPAASLTILCFSRSLLSCMESFLAGGSALGIWLDEDMRPPRSKFDPEIPLDAKKLENRDIPSLYMLGPSLLYLLHGVAKQPCLVEWLRSLLPVRCRYIGGDVRCVFVLPPDVSSSSCLCLQILFMLGQ